MDYFHYSNLARYYYWKAFSYLLCPRFFKHFDKSSILIHPMQVRGAKNICIGKNVTINPFAWLFAQDEKGEAQEILSIGDNVYIGHFVRIGAINRIVIGDNTLMGDKVFISDHNHVFGKGIDIRYSGAVSKGSVHIENNCWIGEGACVLEGVGIGEGSVIGAHAVVTKSVPPYSVAVGAPARVIKTIDSQNGV